jgi:hypothetical protein
MKIFPAGVKSESLNESLSPHERPAGFSAIETTVQQFQFDCLAPAT